MFPSYFIFPSFVAQIDIQTFNGLAWLSWLPCDVWQEWSKARLLQIQAPGLEWMKPHGKNGWPPWPMARCANKSPTKPWFIMVSGECFFFKYGADFLWNSFREPQNRCRRTCFRTAVWWCVSNLVQVFILFLHFLGGCYNHHVRAKSHGSPLFCLSKVSGRVASNPSVGLLA